MRIRVEGFKEMDAALAELTKGAARGVLRRAGMKAMQPIANAAEALAPKDTGELAGAIIVSAQAKGTKVGAAEFSAAMRSGAGKQAAVAAMRDARRAHGGEAPFVELYAGPIQGRTKKDAIKRIVQEFGSYKQAPQPYLRPAWDGGKNGVLADLKTTLAAEIAKAAARAARKAAKLAAKG